jgi:hypothetical protein
MRNTMTTNFRATCCCGACAITVNAPPVINALCHCANCKRRTGSAFGWSAYFPDAAVTATIGAFRTYSVPSKVAGEENLQERVFCGTCGTTLFWRNRHFAGLTGIAGGCFADPPLPEPEATVSNEGRCAWLTLPERWRTDV